MSLLQSLLEKNRQWAERVNREEPGFFDGLASQQAPEYLWIGCSDSRVPANQITGLAPGEVFVHRNVSNVVAHGDLNCLSTVQFAVDVLKVEHIIVCGHYGCGGVHATLEGTRLGLVDNWLHHVRDVMQRHEMLLNDAPAEQRANRLCELNVIEQVVNVCQSTIVQDAWLRGQKIEVHGWIYGVSDGLIRELGLGVDSAENLGAAYDAAIAAVRANANGAPVELPR
ncbi:MAG: carbonate dehydratase [Lysobacteraceae bacterium]